MVDPDMKAKQSKQTKPVEAHKAELPHSNPAISNPAIAGLMADMGNKAERESAERDAWLKDNKPPYVYGMSEYELLRHEGIGIQRSTYNALKSDLFFQPKHKTTWRDYAVEVAARKAYEGLSDLQYLVSQKDQSALASIADIATDATRTLSELSRQALERVRPIAQHRFFWPFLKASKECFGDEHKRIVKEIQLGYAVPFSKDALARVRKDNITVRTAITRLCRLENYRKPLSWFGLNVKTEWQRLAIKLKPFSADTWHEWFEVAWQAVLADYDGHPERDTELRETGQYRAEHTFTHAIGAQKKTISRTRETNIRDGIKEKLKGAIRRLATSKESNK
jgi:hypothetical protein